jgi:GntR family transcriptional regulator
MFIAIDETDPRPIYVQLAAQIKTQIVDGHLEPGQELPSVRDLATGLGIHLHTVRHAYQKLKQEGSIQLRLGKRASVLALPQKPAENRQAQRRLKNQLNELITEAFHLGWSASDFRQLVNERLQARGKPGRDKNGQDR